ncbi:MAG: hypothetical protein RL687_321 [Candidatus Parcubacteria bacterium]|jgi:uncharacterized membrane protein
MQTILADLKKIALLIVLCLILSPLFPYKETEASFGSSYFGGKIISMVTCSCNTDGSSQISISGPGGSSGTYLYSSSAKTYSRNSVKMGSYLLGKYSSGGSCLIGVAPKCTTLPITKGTVSYTGTSF